MGTNAIIPMEIGQGKSLKKNKENGNSATNVVLTEIFLNSVQIGIRTNLPLRWNETVIPPKKPKDFHLLNLTDTDKIYIGDEAEFIFTFNKDCARMHLYSQLRGYKVSELTLLNLHPL